MAAPVGPATRKKVLKVVFFSLLLDLVCLIGLADAPTKDSKTIANLELTNSRSRMIYLRHEICRQKDSRLTRYSRRFTFILPLFPKLLEFYRK